MYFSGSFKKAVIEAASFVLLLVTSNNMLDHARPPLPKDEVMSNLSESHWPMTAGAEMVTVGIVGFSGPVTKAGLELSMVHQLEQ